MKHLEKETGKAEKETVKAENGGYEFECEICKVTLKHSRSIHTHLNSMKHLRRHAAYEKSLNIINGQV